MEAINNKDPNNMLLNSIILIIMSDVKKSLHQFLQHKPAFFHSFQAV